MNITILDFAVVAVPLVILVAALLSRVRESMSRQTDEVKKALLQAHIEILRAKANRNLIRLNGPRHGRTNGPRILPLVSGQGAAV